MAWFRKKEPEVIRRGSANVTEERKSLWFGGQKVEVKRVTEVGRKQPAEKTRGHGRPAKPARGPTEEWVRPDRARLQTSRGRERPLDDEVIIPIDVGRKQMLVRVLPHQTQVVVLEGPVLVEHYVAGQDRSSVVGNIYLGKVRNVLPGMEAAFIDFGANKNGVVYAADVKGDSKRFGNRLPRIEEALGEGQEILVQVSKDAMGAKGARLTGLPSLAGRYLVLVPDSDSQGISRRLPDGERIRLREVLAKVKPEGFGVIVRTAAAHASAEEIAADIDRLVKVWQQITSDAEGGGAPRRVYE
ncbi:MAG: ribonuclease E/G, partial [Acidimicrobiia bacterium]